jgi:hypothetical protein
MKKSKFVKKIEELEKRVEALELEKYSNPFDKYFPKEDGTNPWTVPKWPIQPYHPYPSWPEPTTPWPWPGNSTVFPGTTWISVGSGTTTTVGTVNKDLNVYY